MPRARVEPDDAHSVGGSEQWNDLQTVALCMGWYHVSANSAGPGASQRLDPLFEKVLVGYNYFYKEMGGVVSSQRRGVVYKLRTGKACKNKWQTMNKDVSRFLSCDILATHTKRRSGAGPEEFRADALKYYVARHKGVFKFESAYDYLKDKPKWLRDVAQHTKADGKKRTRTTPGKPTDALRTSDSENERTGPKVPGQKKARRLEKDLVIITAAVAAKEAIISSDIAKFQERAKINMLAVQVEQSRQAVEKEKIEAEREKQDDEIMGKDLTGMEDYQLTYFHSRVTDIFERQATRKREREAANVARQRANEAAEVAAEVSTEETEQAAVLQTAFQEASGSGSPATAECADDTTVIAVVPAVVVTDCEDYEPLTENEVALRFRAQLEDMANAIDTEKGVEEVNQPWLPQGEETVRTIDDSDTDGDT